ncbi:MAG: type IV toxin-antitoxin system AbiEi family antitoxin domain-containing protein [Solirubrobacteraceae bacterium]
MPGGLSRSNRACRGQNATVLAAAVASAQWGVIGLQQLLDCGVSADAADRWRRAGRLHTVHRGIYALGHPTIPIEGRLVAALLHAGPEAVLSHHSAAWWWRLLDREPTVIDVSAPGRRSSLEGVRVHHPRVIDGTRSRRLPVTTVPRTLLDLASRSSTDQIRRALAQADYHRLLVVEEAVAVCGPGRLGAARLRAALERHEPRIAVTRSELERRFLNECEAAGIALPEVNAVVEGWTVDALWRRERIVVELDGRDNHSSPGQIERDRRKELQLRAAGYVVVRYTWAQVTLETQVVMADLRAILSSAGPWAGRGSR